MANTTKNQFVDRKGYIYTFNKAVNNIGKNGFNVLVYHGIAGIGKTSLRQEFPKCLEKYNDEYDYQKVIWASIDLQLASHREKSTFLITLKKELQKTSTKYFLESKLHFRAFEIAHAIYWKKAHPESQLRKENYLLFEGDEKLDPFFGVVNQIPYFSVVPAVARLLKTAPDHLRKWWTKKLESELNELSEKEPLDIEKYLTHFWVRDLNKYLEDNSKYAVFFIDTYEDLFVNHSSDSCSLNNWIRDELISNNLSQKVLWVICGREALCWENSEWIEWSEHLTQYRVRELPEKYHIKYLETRGITDEKIQEVISKGSKGIPYYLELSVDTYEKIKIYKNRQPEPEDFGGSHQEITERFFKYLSPEEKNALSVLSITHFWDYELFEYLVNKSIIVYPTANYEDLCRFSFINKEDNKKRQMHQLMQESLQKTQEKRKPDSVKRTHEAIREYYSKKFESIDIKEITQEHEIALNEAFYHAKESLKAEDLFEWFTAASYLFFIAAFWQLIAPMYEEMLQIFEVKLETGHPNVATTLNTLGELYRHIGDYNKALTRYQRALDIREKVLGPQHPDVAQTLNALAITHRNIGNYNKALTLYQRALDIRENVLDPEHPDVAQTLNDLAVLYEQGIGDYEKALTLYQRALDIRENVLDPEHLDIAQTLNNLARIYHRIGNYKKALPLYQGARNIREKVLGSQHPFVATTLNNLALLYEDIGEYEKALPLYQRALEIYEKSLIPHHPANIETLNGLVRLYGSMRDYKKALSLYLRVLDISEKTVGLAHSDVADVLNNLASIYKIMRDDENAFSLDQNNGKQSDNR